MIQRIYQVDAFADKTFTGNPAAVCPLKEWLPDDLLQNIAMENNLSETAFYVKGQEKVEIRWFTPTTEVDLCGHATLAAAYTLFYHEGFSNETIEFVSSRSGELPITKTDRGITLNFPTDQLEKASLSEGITSCFDIRPSSVYQGNSDLLVVFKNEKDVRNLSPDFRKLNHLDARGVIVTAPGDNVDFVSRFFGPQVGVDEDPVTGSAHTTLTPYWAERLGKMELSARQLSNRGGNLSCKLIEERVEIAGKAKLYMIGEIFI